MSYLLYFFWLIIAYSALITVVIFYKEKSDRYTVDTVDIIVAGPVCWISVLVYFVIAFIEKTLRSNSKNFIRKIVRKTVRNYKKYEKNTYCYIDLEQMFCIYHHDIKGYGNLEILNPNPFGKCVNKQFEYLMENRWEDTCNALMLYFEPLTEERMRMDGKSEDFIDKYKDTELLVALKR